ncbi:MAG: amidohydrolase family protein [Bacteroidetes bacterium]|nr:amidohydrolase family protein [Bacteroidota bacterium]
MKTFLLTLFCLTANSVFAHDFPASPKQTKPIALVGGTIHTLTGETIENGTVLFENGKITRIGKTIDLPAGTEIIQVTGKQVWPAILAPASVLGLREIDAVRQTNDQAEMGSNNADVRAEIGYNTDSELIPVARANGIGYNLTIPVGGLIAGHAALMKLNGWTWEETLVKKNAGLVVNWPQMSVREAPWITTSAEDQKKQIQKNLEELKSVFNEARAYQKAKKSALSENHAYDSKWEGFLSVLEKKEPVIVSADELNQIVAAVQFFREQDVNMILLGGKEGYKCLDVLKSNQIPVLIGSVFSMPGNRDDDFDISYKTAKLYHDAGIPFAITNLNSDMTGSESNLRNLPHEAGYSVGFGLPHDEGFKAISLYPAQILGVADRIGSLEVGKDASIMVTDGDPLEVISNVEFLFIDGAKIELKSHHTVLRDKYEERWKQ